VFQQTADKHIGTVAWLAAYNNAKAGTVDKINPDDERMVVRYADAVVRKTQGSMNPEDASNIEAQNAAARLFTIFASWFIGQGNFIVTEGQLVLGDKTTGKAGKAMDLANMYLMLYLIPSFGAELIGAAMRGQLPDDDDDDGKILDDWFEFFALSQAKYPAAMVPYVNVALNYILGKFTAQPFDDRITLSPAQGLLEQVLSAPFSVWEAVFEDGDVSKATRETLALLGVTTNLPTGFVKKPAAYLADIAEGESDADGFDDILQGLTTGSDAER
jgi:hypothetical protein